jgi:hypothetical protein
MRLVEFQGQVFLRVGDALTTEALYRNFLPSVAHIYYVGPDKGNVMRYGEKLGDASEVLDLDEPVDVEVESMDGLMDPGWMPS